MADREASNVITSENSGEFYANKLGLATETPTEAVVENTPTEPVDTNQASEPKADDEPKTTEDGKPNPKVKMRFDEVTKARDMARQEAERERQRASDLERQIEELKKANSPTQTFDTDAEPQPSQFADAFEYAKALSEWSAENAVKQMKRSEAEAKIAAERATVIEAWQKRQEEAKAEIPDYEDVISSSELTVSDQVRDAIIESDVGPRILYHLAENPEVAEALSKKSVTAALREIGRLEARFERKDEPTKPVATKSNAPTPIKPLKASSTVADVRVDSNGQFHGTYQQWKESRKAGKIK